MYFYSPLEWKKTSYMERIAEIIINIQTNVSKWNNMILEIYEKNNHQISSLYDG
jgi:hypothetical protein